MKYTITIELTHLGLEDKGESRKDAALDQLRSAIEHGNMHSLLGYLEPQPAARLNINEAHYCLFNGKRHIIGTVTGKMDNDTIT